MFRVDDFPNFPGLPWGFFRQETGAILVAILQVAMWQSTAIHGYIRNLEIWEVGPSLVTKVAKAGGISPQMPGIHEKSQI